MKSKKKIEEDKVIEKDGFVIILHKDKESAEEFRRWMRDLIKIHSECIEKFYGTDPSTKENLK